MKDILLIALALLIFAFVLFVHNDVHREQHEHYIQQ